MVPPNRGFGSANGFIKKAVFRSDLSNRHGWFQQLEMAGAQHGNANVFSIKGTTCVCARPQRQEIPGHVHCMKISPEFRADSELKHRRWMHKQ